MSNGNRDMHSIATGVAIMAICGMGGVLYTTTQIANNNKAEIEHRVETIKAVPALRTDIEVIKVEQRVISEQVDEIKQDTRKILEQIQQIQRRPE